MYQVDWQAFAVGPSAWPGREKRSDPESKRQVERPTGYSANPCHVSRADHCGQPILCKVSLKSMAATRCTDRVVGAILASWRYDISGISPEMRKDYEGHYANYHEGFA